MKRRLPPSAGVRCSATLVRGGRCKARYQEFARPQLCGRHHRVLRRHLALFNAPPKLWIDLRPRDWRTGSLGLVVLGPDETLRFLAAPDGEPLQLGAGGGADGRLLGRAVRRGDRRRAPCYGVAALVRARPARPGARVA